MGGLILISFYFSSQQEEWRQKLRLESMRSELNVMILSMLVLIKRGKEREARKSAVRRVI